MMWPDAAGTFNCLQLSALRVRSFDLNYCTGGIFTRQVDYAYQILRKMATRWLKLKYIEKNINYKL